VRFHQDWCPRPELHIIHTSCRWRLKYRRATSNCWMTGLPVEVFRQRRLVQLLVHSVEFVKGNGQLVRLLRHERGRGRQRCHVAADRVADVAEQGVRDPRGTGGHGPVLDMATRLGMQDDGRQRRDGHRPRPERQDRGGEAESDPVLRPDRNPPGKGSFTLGESRSAAWSRRTWRPPSSAAACGARRRR
jgi:hypothetical protein